MNKIKFYLTDQTTGKTIKLPINPAEIKLKYETDDKQETIVNLGQVNILGDLKLVSLSIESAFPNMTTFKPSYADKEAKKPDTYINALKKIQKSKHKVRLVVSGTKINLLMTISSFEYGMVDGFADEYTYTLELMQYKKFGYKKLKSPKKKGKKGKGGRSKPAKKINVGSSVKVNGRLHADSYGRGAGIYEKNAKRTVLYICPGRKYPVCVGIGKTARGWVKMSEVKRA